jgi:hypothetical protein
MNHPATFDATQIRSTRERNDEVRLSALWPFIVAVAILAIVAFISDGRLTPDQRIQVFQQSGVYP